MSPRPFRLALAAACVLLCAAGTARADDVPSSRPLRWDPQWSHAGAADYVLGGVGLGVLGAEAVWLEPQQPTLHWSAPFLFDQDVRDVLRGSTPQVREDATVASWALLGMNIAYPVVVDVPYAWSRYGKELAWDLFWQDAVALSLVSATDLALRNLVGRARPPVSECLAAGGSASQCLGSNTEATMSFPGGHVAVATTGATLTCTQHLSMHLYGAPWDAVTCGSAIGVDVTMGMLRIVTDNHWTSDILAGGLLGFAFGWAMPLLMHLHRHGEPGADTGILLAPVPIAVDHGAGIGVTGMM
ncbi:MAG TPA: phosphatase PAP2 family protein [Polyangiaceae bacterium]